MFDNAETELIEELAEYELDALGFVWYAFPWGEAGELEDERPEDWQIGILQDISAGLVTVNQAIQLATTSGHGVGKAQPVSLVIDTPLGRRRWGDLRAGDLVFGRNGKPTYIKAVHPQGKKNVYKVTFDDGSSTEVCEEHLWTVRGRRQRRTGAPFVTMSTKDIVQKGVKRKNGVAMARQWELPRIEAVEYPKRELPVEPYMLGVWLGDGSGSRFVSEDEEVAYMAAPTATKERKVGTEALSYYVSGLKKALTSLGIARCTAKDKFVPRVYKETSSFDRAELLRGLLDTDGECTKTGSIVFSSISYTLAADVVWLARSLGGKAQFQPTEKQTGYKKEDGTFIPCQICFRVTVQMPHDFLCFYIERKQERARNADERYLTRWIDAIELVAKTECMCITVEAEDQLYLTNDFIPTHNSALVSWIILWAMSTMPDTKGVVTANTENQLKTKTWVEVAKWYRLFIGRNLFKLTATALFSIDPEHEKTWRFDMVPWSERNTEAFAGLHNAERRIVVIFDEGSGIPDTIWEVTEGALTDESTQIVWAVFGNPTRNSGRFRECFAGGKFAHRWKARTVDSRSVRRTNKEQLERWVQDYGEDHDFVRVRVQGVFPRQDAVSFIPLELAREAAARQLDPEALKGQPVVMGVDVARYGDDVSVLYFRKGRDGKSIAPEIYQGVNTVQLAAHVASAFTRHACTMVFVDGGGVGGGVVDNLRRLRVPHMEVQFGAKADGVNLVDPQTRYANKRAEIWGAMRDWLKDGAIPDQLPNYDQDLTTELANPTFAFNNREEIQLERKDDMRRRGVKSPNIADALACTFAYPVYTPPLTQELETRPKEEDYNPYDRGNIYDDRIESV